jgi:hypothetical protein
MEDTQFDKLKEEYIEMRKSTQFTATFFYKYYTYKGGDLDFSNFNNVFRLGSLHDILEYLDKVFGLDKVFDKDGNLVKIIL